MIVKFDPNHNEPAPKRYFAIHCFDCGKDVPSRGTAKAKHQGHDVDYVDASGERMS